MIDAQQSDSYQKARLSRDARFDGLFFIAVKTTGIYCRPICPASPPKEQNVEYFHTAVQAANAGYRPCLRCHPDSAPNSNRWQGAKTSFQRAIKLIDQGALQTGSVEQLADRLGITERYLRNLFHTHLGLSPKRYALYQQCLFAKQLLHQSHLSITEIALASGFNSLRRFNDCFKNSMGMAPSTVRRSNEALLPPELTLKLYYRPPFNWQLLLQFLRQRQIEQLDWCHENTYGRTIELGASKGYFEISPQPTAHYLNLNLHLNAYQNLNILLHQIRRLFDLDANSQQIDQQLEPLFFGPFIYHHGLRLPGTWSLYEAGVRAILGQQVSVKAATNLVTTLVSNLGRVLDQNKRLFPSPESIANSELAFLKMPQSRKDTLIRFSQWWMQTSNQEDIEQWLSIKGIGLWTADYARMRGLGDPDVWLGSDLGVKKQLSGQHWQTEKAAPWRSYLTLQLWHQ